MNATIRAIAFAGVALAALPVTRAAASAPAYAILLDNGPFWSAVARGIASVDDTIKTSLPPVPGPGPQLRYLAFAREQKLPIVLLDPYWRETDDAVRALAADGAKLVALDNELPAAVPHWYVGHHKAGLNDAAANLVADLAGETGEVAILRMQNEKGFTAREQAILDRLKQRCPRVAVHADVFGADDADRAEQQTKLLLGKYPRSTVLVTTNTGHSLAALRVLRAGANPVLRFVAFGVALPPEVEAGVKDGRLHTWIAQDPFELGRKAAAVVQDLAAGRAVPPAIHVDAVFVNRENLGEPRIQALRR